MSQYPPQTQYPNPNQYPVGPPPVPTDGTATAVLVLGIVSIVTSLFGFGWITAIIALILAPGAERNIAASGGRLDGEQYVRVGRICSYVALAITAVVTAVTVIFYLGFFALIWGASS